MKKLFAALAGSLLITLLLVAPAHADVNDFVIEAFDADYTLSNTDKQGELRVTEHINVNFSDNNHGILRAIPDSYKKHRLELTIEKVSSDSGAPAPYTTYGSNGNTVLKIGDPNRTVTGRQSYTITYDLHNVISFYNDHDELYWDINGDQWAQTAQSVTAAVHLPAGLGQTQEPTCYTGSFGSTQQMCRVDNNTAAHSIVARTTQPLQGYQTLSLVAGFKKGYFAPPTWLETAGEYAGMAAKFLIPFVLLAGTAGRHWYKNGRDPKGRGVIVPEYEPPDGLKPIEVGTVADFRTDNRDITAVIIDLAIRGYVKIIEWTKEHKFVSDAKTYSLRLEKASLDGLDEFELVILRDIFSNYQKGEEVDLATLKYKLSSTAAQLRRDVRQRLVANDYFHKTPLAATMRFIGLLILEFIAMVILAIIFQGSAVTLGIAAGTVLAVIFIILLPARTPKGVAARESIMGLKLYLEVAEKERINKLQSPDAPYAPKSAEPKKTVELFEKLLPFAMVLGVEQQWAKKFESIYRTPPNWYQGNWAAFSSVYLVSSLNSGVQAGINSAFSTQSSSSSSGFSGGGFAGGGGGGGGGGGW